MNERHDPPSPRLPSPLNYEVTRRARHEDIASMVPARLEELPRLRGFRLRGLEMTRLETFIDAAFAFAISMLVIAAQQIPDNIQALLAAFRNVPTFICSIAAEILLLYLRAWQLRGPLRLNARESLMTRGELLGWSIPVSVGIVALILALTLPIENIEWAGWVYFSMAFLVPLFRVVHKRRLEKEEGRIKRRGSKQ